MFEYNTNFTFSIITVTYNAINTIEITIKNAAQIFCNATYKDISIKFNQL